MSAVPVEHRFPSAWRSALAPLALLLLAIGLLYRDTAMVLTGIWWRSETFAHCFLVPPITLWLVWRQRERLARLTPKPQPWVLALMVGAALVWLLADLMFVNAAAQFAFVAMLILAVPAVLGFEVAITILFPLLFLFFGVPFGEFLLPTMMEWTANFTVAALQATGVPVFREGQNFVIPSGSWSVIDECSGVRYVMASVMVGSLFAYLNYRSYLRRVVFMVFSLLVPIVANWIRAYMIVMLAHLSGNRIATGVDHIVYGWVFFGLIIFVMFIVGSRWAQPDAPLATAPAHSPGGPFETAVTRGFLATALAAAAVVAAPSAVQMLLLRAEGQAAEARFELPAQLEGGWTSQGAQLVAWVPQFGSPSSASTQAYRGPAGTVGVIVAYYRGQREDRKIVSSQNLLVGMRDPQWNLPLDTGRRDVDLGGRQISVRTADILGRTQLTNVGPRPHLTVWRVYWIDGSFIAGDTQAKLAGMFARLRGHGDEGASLMLYADGEPTEASHATLQAFLQANINTLNALLQRTQATR